jgi:hypothetical protein
MVGGRIEEEEQAGQGWGLVSWECEDVRGWRVAQSSSFRVYKGS